MADWKSYERSSEESLAREIPSSIWPDVVKGIKIVRETFEGKEVNVKTYKAEVRGWALDYDWEAEPIIVQAESLEEARDKIQRIASEQGIGGDEVHRYSGSRLGEVVCVDQDVIEKE